MTLRLCRLCLGQQAPFKSQGDFDIYSVKVALAYDFQGLCGLSVS